MTEKTVKRMLGFAGLASASMLAPSAADAALTLNLRFDDGSTTKQVDTAGAPTTYTINVYAAVTGTGAGSEGLNAMYFGAQTQLLQSNLDGDITARALGSTFAQSGSSTGTLQSITHAPAGSDSQTDWGGASLSSSTGWGRANAGSGQYPTSGIAITNGVEFQIGTFTYTINSLTASTFAVDTTVLKINPVYPSSLAPAGTRATWLQDGVQINSSTPTTGVYQLGTSVNFTVGAAAATDNTVTLASVAIPASPTLNITGGQAAGYVGDFEDITNAQAGTVGINAVAPVSGASTVLVALDLEGYSNLPAFIESLEQLGGYGFTTSNISANTPGWINTLPGAGTDWELLLSFNTTSGSPFNFSWDFAGIQDGTTLDRIAVVPEPATLSILGLGAAALLTRRRRHG